MWATQPFSLFSSVLATFAGFRVFPALFMVSSIVVGFVDFRRFVGFSRVVGMSHVGVSTSGHLVAFVAFVLSVELCACFVGFVAFAAFVVRRFSGFRWFCHIRTCLSFCSILLVEFINLVGSVDLFDVVGIGVLFSRRLFRRFIDGFIDSINDCQV